MFVGVGEFVPRSIPVAVRLKTFGSHRLYHGIPNSNPNVGLDIRLLCLWCVV